MSPSFFRTVLLLGEAVVEFVNCKAQKFLKLCVFQELPSLCELPNGNVNYFLFSLFRHF